MTDDYKKGLAKAAKMIIAHKHDVTLGDGMHVSGGFAYCDCLRVIYREIEKLLGQND